MKKLMLLALICILLFSVFGCGVNVNRSIDFDTDIFSDFLDDEQFVPSMSQAEFVAQMGKYSYNQVPITETDDVLYADGNNGGTFAIYSDGAQITIEHEAGVQTNHLWVFMPLDNLTLPRDIGLEDTLEAVLQKLDVDIDPQDDFVADQGNESGMTVYRNDTATLSLTNRAMIPQGERFYGEGYMLTYEESCETDQGSTTGTRRISMVFDEETMIAWGMSASHKESV